MIVPIIRPLVCGHNDTSGHIAIREHDECQFMKTMVINTSTLQWYSELGGGYHIKLFQTTTYISCEINLSRRW